MDMSEMTPRRPYLLRALYDWLVDNNLTPHLLVDVTLADVLVPMEFARDGQIVLNIAQRAVGNLLLGDDGVSFNARFGGVSRQVSVPMAAVLAIYGRENGAGMLFEAEAAYDDEGVNSEVDVPKNLMSLVDDGRLNVSDDNTPPDDLPPSPRGGRPALRVVK